MATGAELRAAREAAGLSLSRMAQRTHFAKSYLSMVETGKRAVAQDVISAYEQVLGVPLQSDAGDPVRVAHEWLVGESPMAAHVRSGRRVGVSLAEELEARVVELRHLDDVVSSGVLRRGDAGSEPEWVYWLNQAEIDVMAGRCLIELGRPADAEPLLANAVASYPAEHAREVALYLTWLAESHARTGDLDAARDVVERAQRHAATMPSARAEGRLDSVARLL
ncbi:helix-turn-helix domain-containing protein [Saccharopolyspora endophytica]|nr:helix-turn-helix domain-containing protein [Saccharopolyspora endophytica]